MTLEFRLPDVGEGTDSAELVEWHVAVGDAVREDQPLCEIETDKAVVGIPCPTTGSVLALCAQEGETVAVGAVLAVFGAPGEAVARPPQAQAVASSAGATGSNDARTAAGPALPVGDSQPVLEPAAVAAAAATAAGRPLASPPARQRARDTGVDLASVSGSGPFGAVLPADLGGAAAGGGAAPRRADERRALRGTRRTIARTLTAQWQTVPHVTDYREVDAGGLLDLRRRLRADAQLRGEDELAAAITATPVLVKLAATLLRRHPLLNAAIDMEREEITVYGAINIGVATATKDGLMVPVIHDADGKTIAEIAVECAALAVAARGRTLAAADLAGATFTLNNYGALGIWLGTPIIAPRQAANLGIGRIEDRAVVRDGEIVVRPIAAIACAGDHRLLDGDVIARFVSDLVRAIEDPLVLFGELR
jgi:pyruvate dehydrogenase E2 component (dihydrolipoamide acetyltransferase)